MKLLICGKGGCGKSTVAALLARTMDKRGRRVLLVDADESNIGLYRMLGLDMPQPLMDSLGGKKGFRDRTRSAGVGLGSGPALFPETMTLDTLPSECVAVSQGLRVMSLGKIHHFGEGCACPMGSLFRMFFSSLSLGDREVVIVDTAAGVEHFGRSLDGQCDHLLCVVDPCYESIMMARRVQGFAREAGLPVSVVLNRISPDVEEQMRSAMEGFNVIGSLSASQPLFLSTLKGEALDLDLMDLGGVCDAIGVPAD